MTDYEKGYKDGMAGAALPNIVDNGDKIDGYRYMYKTDSDGVPFISIESVRSMLSKAAEGKLKETKRLLKLATEDLAKIPCNNDVYIPSSCNACIKQDNCDYSDSFKWRYADKAIKLIGGSENG